MKAMNSMPAPGFSATGRAARDAAPRPGQIVGERYLLEEWLERGAMGSVWRAQQIRLRSPAAIKFLDPSLIEVPEMLERFLQEARSAAAVQSAHVIQIFDYGSHGGLPYIAMEFLEGENLGSRLAFGGVLTPAQLNKVFNELARGIGQAHALGVIHRDVKPGNVFLAREGKHEVTKLIDFGIAKVRQDALRVSQVVGTELGVVLGTPQYMSPEQLRGWSNLDHRTDLWALAIIACECLTGCCPFSGTTLGDLTVQICTEEPLAPSALGDVPAGFDDWFFKATRKEPSERFASASEMAEALAHILVPGQRMPASVRSGSASVPPSVRELRHAWAATSSSVRRLSALALARAAEGAGSFATLVRRRSRRLSRAVAAELGQRPAAWRWVGLGAVAVALLVVAGSRILGPAPVAVGVPVASPEREVQAALPRPATLPSGAVAPAREPLPRAALPVLNAEDLPLAGAAETAPVQRPTTPTRAPEAPKRGKKPGASAASADSSATGPSSPMSEAMVRIGALIAQGGEKGRPARPASKAPAPRRGDAKTK